MHRREFLSSIASTAAGAALHGLAPAATAAIDAASRQATGVKIGEVSHNGALAWMRLTERATRQADGELRRGNVKPFPQDRSTRELEGSTPGAPGSVRLDRKSVV